MWWLLTGKVELGRFHMSWPSNPIRLNTCVCRLVVLGRMLYVLAILSNQTQYIYVMTADRHCGIRHGGIRLMFVCPGHLIQSVWLHVCDDCWRTWWCMVDFECPCHLIQSRLNTCMWWLLKRNVDFRMSWPSNPIKPNSCMSWYGGIRSIFVCPGQLIQSDWILVCDGC